MSRRSYDNSAREIAARETRARILATAYDLVVDEGLTALTIATLARRASVSPQTIYNAIGGKAEVLKACYDIALAGDDEPVPIAERPAFRAMFEADTPEGFVDRYATWCTTVYERVGALLGAVTRPGAGVGADEFMATVEAERRAGTRGAMGAFTGRFGLPATLDLDRVVDLVWTLNSPEVYDRLVRQCEWSRSEYEAWLARTLRASLCNDT